MRLFRGDAYLEVDTDNEKIRLDQRDKIYRRRLAISFEVQLTDSKHPNKGLVNVYNLAESTRMKILRSGKTARVFAGYDGQEKLIGTGNITFADARKEGADWVTQLRFGDGQDAYDNATTTVSLSDGSSVQTVIGMMAKDMGVVLKASKDALEGIIDGSLSLDGLTKDELTTVTRDKGLTWSIQDSELHVRKVSQPIDDEAIVLSSATGLMEVQKLIKPPKTASGSKNADDTADVKIRAQLNPDLRPGKLVKVESVSHTVVRSDSESDKEGDSSYNGVYICRNVTFSGDNYGGDFEVTCEADQYVQ